MTLEMSDFYPTIQATDKPSPKQAPTITPSPPDRIDLLLDIIEVRQQLKTILEEIADGNLKADKELTARIYIMQQIVYTDKTVLDAMKEAAKIQINNQTNIEANVKVDVKSMLAEYDAFVKRRNMAELHIQSNSSGQPIHTEATTPGN